MGEICREPAIVIRNLYKEYKLGETNARSLQGEIREKWQKRRGKLPLDPLQNEEGGKRFLALNDINLTVYKGETVGIIGKNGSGKSTLLKLISRITAPTRGRIDIYGRVTSMLEVGTGFNGDMTGRENIYLNGAILGMTQAEIDRKLKDIIAFSEVEKFIDTPVKRYSSGMYVKLGFSVAAHLTSDIMIMDEVLAVGYVTGASFWTAAGSFMTAMWIRLWLFISDRSSRGRRIFPLTIHKESLIWKALPGSFRC